MSKRFKKNYPPRKLQDKMWRPCQDFETKSATAVGKLCSRRGEYSKKKKRRIYKSVVKDFCSPQGFEFFRAGSFVFIDEDEL